jgi:DNA polymerase/3'-5' exonuclease PolX
VSEGPRYPLQLVRDLARDLMHRWAMDDGGCFVVGSVRRGQSFVGDLELLAPLPEAWRDKRIAPVQDPLFQCIDATASNQWGRVRGGLFGTGGHDGQEICLALRGLKPGFLACSLEAKLGNGRIPVQIFRYTPENLGWMLIERTGPRDFGIWFLGKWKLAHGIPTGDDTRPASVENHLIDGSGRTVPVADEAAAFGLAGLQWVRPEIRDEFAKRVRPKIGV